MAPAIDDDDDMPVIHARKRQAPAASAIKSESDLDSDSDSPIASQRAASQPAAKRAKTNGSQQNKRPKKETAADAKKVAKRVAKKDPKEPKKETKKVVKRQPAQATGKSESPDAEDEDDDSYKWWELNPDAMDGSVKWETLEHNGVMFPPAYEPLPKGVHLVYDGKPVSLPLEAEEVAGFFGAMLTSGDHCQNPVFQKNFFADFLDVLKECGGAKNKATGEPMEISDFSKCDFNLIHKHYEAEREAKKALPSAEKKRLKAEKDQLEEKYKICLLNGRKEMVGNFRVEPPGLFRGRGAHPKTGKLKRRVAPEQITINIGKDAKIPPPPEGHQWGEVKHDNTVAWLATWKENINNQTKYVLFAADSSLKGISDFKKFEKARNLKKYVGKIRSDYRKELRDPVMQIRQRATAMYLIDVLALRAGGEKGEDEADTVGCCSLRYEHVILKPPQTVVFDFLGKDSIRFHQEVDIDKQVFKNLIKFKAAPKKEGDQIFDRLDPPTLNKHLQSYMPGLTAKVFRTYNASHTMQQQLDKIPNTGTVAEKMVAFNAANRAVAILCNHQRTVTKGHGAQVEKIGDKIAELEWQKCRLLKMMLQLDPTLKKKKPGIFLAIDSVDKDTEKEIHERILEREKIKIEKKFEKDNEKLVAEGQKKMLKEELKKRLEVVADLKKEYAAELKSGKPELKGNATVEKLEAQVEKLDDRITTTRFQLQDKEDNSTVSLGTSKTNYIDPRLIAMFSKKFEVPIEKLFSKTLRKKFAWAIESADKNWKF